MTVVGDAYLELRLYYLWRCRSSKINSTIGMNLADGLTKNLSHGNKLNLGCKTARVNPAR